MSKYHIPLLPDGMYHIHSRAVGNEKLFLNDGNYEFFLRKYKKYILPVADTFAFSLLPNLFHFLVQIKPPLPLESYFIQKNGGNSFDLNQAPNLIMKCFSNLLNSYTKSFNNVYERKGSLFIDYLRRVEINRDKQLGPTVFYIHNNSVHHGYSKKISTWRWSSYNMLVGNSETILKRTEVLDWFGGLPAFEQYHKQPIYLKNAQIIEY